MLNSQSAWRPSLQARRSLRIVQVSTSDLGGGAELVAWNLHQAYRDCGHRACLVVGRKNSSDQDVHEFEYQAPPLSFAGACSLLEKGIRCLDRRVQGSRRVCNLLKLLQRGWHTPLQRLLGLEDFNFPASHSLLSFKDLRPDIIHAHNLHGGYFDLRLLPVLARRAPLVLTLHDAWLLSGHCAHSLGCDRWQTGCGKCPDLTLYPSIRRDATAWNWRRKRNIFARSSLYVATPSRWLMQQVERSILAPAIIDARIIANGIDLSIFCPTVNRSDLRRRLGIDPDCRVLVFAAYGLRTNVWKDYATLRAALSHIASEWSGPPILCLALGDQGPPEQIGPLRIEFIPFLTNPTHVADYLNSADVYVHPARAETFGRSIIEAMACGIPIVASRVGGIPELLENREPPGLLVPQADPRALAQSLQWLLSNEAARSAMGLTAAGIARRKFDLRQQADSYLNWYDTILASKFDQTVPGPIAYSSHALPASR